MNQVRKLELLALAANEATAKFWQFAEMTSAEATLHTQAAAFAEVIGGSAADGQRMASEQLPFLKANIETFIEKQVTAALENAQKKAEEEQVSHLKFLSDFREHAAKGQELLASYVEDDPKAAELFAAQLRGSDNAILQAAQNMHRTELFCFFKFAMASNETAEELAKLYEVSDDSKFVAKE